MNFSRVLFFRLVHLAVGGLFVSSPLVLAQESPIDFVRDVRPVLSENCFRCHGPDKATRETELRFDDEESAKGDLGGYNAIVPGDPDASELIERIFSDDEYSIMPPIDSHLSLTEQEKETLRLWIEQGAVWAEHWAFVKPVQHRPSLADDSVEDEGEVNRSEKWIDHFIIDRLARDGFRPNPEADLVTLVRRLHFDLTGLPPFPEQVTEVVDGRKSLDQLVDELLASPHYGERMATFWFDLVRFADTVGYHGDQDHNITPYRDYVIDAFNENMPFDRFSREQLAGDLIEGSSMDQQIASGYNRLLQTSHEGGVQPQEYLTIYAADRVRNVSEVWMGATIGCAQCHDHKFDPYTLKDFYALAAFFADIDEAEHFAKGTNSIPTNRPPEIEVLTKRDRTRLVELQNELQQLQNLSPDNADHDSDRLADLEQKIAEVQARNQKTMITVALSEPRTTRILARGNWMDESGEVVLPAVPEFLPPIHRPDNKRATRLDLANYLVDTEQGHGLFTARVFVNRVWAIFFGRGLSPSLDDFGVQGEPPVYPELLDQLTIEFVHSGWNIKDLVKQIVSSQTYRQSSIASPEQRDRDPGNRLFARQSSFRLPAEFIRDNALAVSGMLIREVGGPSVKPYQPAGYYQHLNFPTRTYKQHDDDRQWRRGLYVHWQRQFLHPMLYAFDAPRREECTAQRNRSNTPSAALVLLNDPTFVEAARALAVRIMLEAHESDQDRIEFAFRLVLSRSPDDVERSAMLDLLRVANESFTESPEEAEQLLSIGNWQWPESLARVDLASWTMVGRAMLNLAETFTRD